MPGKWEGLHSQRRPFPTTVFSQCGAATYGSKWRGPSKFANDYKCIHCGKAFSHKHKLVDHEKVHTEEKLYECRECGEVFLRNSHLDQHQKAYTEARLSDHLDCGVFYTQILSLSDHQRIYTRPRHFECSQCGKTFLRLSQLVAHQKVHSAERPMVAVIVGNSLQITPNWLDIREFILERGLMCAVNVGKPSATNKLIEHQKMQSDEKPYECTECRKAFNRKDKAVVPENPHWREAYVCSEGGKTFSHKYKLVKHQKIHSGEKAHECSRCGKSFLDDSTHIIHQRVHTRERPYECSEWEVF